MKKISTQLKKRLVAIHQEPTKQSEEKFGCPYCQDRGIIIDGETAYRCQCVKQQSVIKKFASANMTPFLISHTFDRFSLRFYSPHLKVEKDGPSFRAMAEKALQGAKEFVAYYVENGIGRGLLFEGDVGSGKTFLAGAVTNALLEHGIQALFLVVPDFLDDLRATYQKQGEFSEAELMDAARKAEVLVLDDLGAHNFTEWTQNKIFSLINFRMNHGLPCVITTNIPIDEMNEVIGARTVSRIIEICKIYRLHVEKDIRIVLRQSGF